MDPNCLFCKIVAGEIPSDIVYQDDKVVAFSDIKPEAPVHVLIVPRRHIPAISELDEADASVMGELFLAAKKVAKALGINESGYRLVVNNGPDAGQDVFHVHMHLLGGRLFGWPPG